MHSYRIDYETRSRADLKTVGAARYAFDPSTEILCVAVARDNERPLIWTPFVNGVTALECTETLRLLREAAESKDSTISAHNAMFEVFISEALWQKTFGFPPPSLSQWRCTMAKVRRAALPNSLAKAAEALGLVQKKDHRGAALIRKFCIPNKDTGEFVQPLDDPAAFKEFLEYCRQDVVVEREVDKALKYFDLKGLPLNTYQFDLDMNVRGIPVNLDALRKADAIVEQETALLAKEFKAITGLEHTQTKKILPWFKANGYKGGNLRAETLEKTLEDSEFDESTPLGRALQIKKSIGFASLKKIKTMLACAGPHDSRVRGTMNYYGAGTGRWSAALIQPQNFKKPSKHLEDLTEAIYQDVCDGATGAYLSLAYGPPLECLSSCIRHFIHLPGEEFTNADYSAIEARIIAWQAGEEWRMDVFRTHGQIYEASVSQMFGVPLDEILNYPSLHNGKKHPLRAKGKVAELSCGYQGGVGAMVRMGAEREGLQKSELASIVKGWREKSPRIVKMWADADKSAKAAVEEEPVREFGKGCWFHKKVIAGITYLLLRLPSGREIAYPHPKLEKQIRWRKVDKKTGEESFESVINPTDEQVRKAYAADENAWETKALTYWGQIPMKSTWGRISLYGGKSVENLCQGIAADVMAIGAYNAWKAGYDLFALIHDEALGHFKEGQSIEEFTDLLTRMPEWADGLPLKAEGGVIPFYRK